MNLSRNHGTTITTQPWKFLTVHKQGESKRTYRVPGQIYVQNPRIRDSVHKRETTIAY